MRENSARERDSGSEVLSASAPASRVHTGHPDHNNELGQQIKKTIKKEFMGQVEILDESNFAYRRVLDGPVQLQANNQTANLEFLFENTPPFSMVGYKVKAASLNNPLNLVEGEFVIIPDVSGQMKTLEKDGLSNSLFENEYDAEGRLTKKTSRFNGHRLITDVR